MAVSVVAIFTIKEGQKEAFADYMRELIDLTKQEDGCFAYDLYEATDGSSECVMVEIWESQEKLDKHFETEHFKKFVPGADVYQSAPANIRIFNRL